MTLWNRLRMGLARKLAPEIFAATLRNIDLTFADEQGKTPNVSHAALVSKYWGWVYACAQLSATRLAATPLRLYAARSTGQSRVKNFPARQLDRDEFNVLSRKESLQSLAVLKAATDIEEILDHPILELLRNVNEFNNAFETIELTGVCLDLTGNAYWYLPPTSLGVPTEMWVLRPQLVKIVPDRKEFIRGYLYGSTRETQIRIEPENIIHFKYVNVADMYYGLGPVQAGAYAIDRQEKMDRYERSMLANMGRPDFIVNYPDANPNDRKTKKELMREWNNAYNGPDKAGKVHITMGGKAEIDKIGFTPREMQFLEGRPWTLKEIAGMFPVPVGLIDTEQISKAPRAGIEGSDLTMAKLNTLPRTQRIEQKLNEKLTPRYDRRLFLSFDNPVPEDRRFELKRTESYVRNWIMSINEVRALNGMDPQPWGDVPLVPMNIFPLGTAPEANASEPKKMIAVAGYAVPGDGCKITNDDEKPFENEHAARMREPGEFVRIRQLWARQGIRALGGPLKRDPRGPVKVQTFRFNRHKWTVARARKWLRDHGHKPIRFEPATGGKTWVDGSEIHPDLRRSEIAVGN